MIAITITFRGNRAPQRSCLFIPHHGTVAHAARPGTYRMTGSLIPTPLKINR